MPNETPLVRTREIEVPAVAAGSDAETDLEIVPDAGTITKVAYVPASVLTGANTNSRTCVLVNKGAAGSGTATPATKAFVTGVNASADVENDFTLSSTPSDLVCAAGDVLVWQSTHVGTGLADPGGMLHIEISRS